MPQRQRLLRLASSLSILFATADLSAAPPTEVSIPADKLQCLVDHQDEYLALPRNLIIFFAEACPEIDGVLAELSMNKEGDTEAPPVRRPRRLFLLKTDFRCLIEKIEQRAKSPQTQAAANERVRFVLDCD